MRKKCRVCHVVTDLDENGRCAFCALCYEAVEAGTSYGKYVAQRDRMQPVQREPQPEKWPEAITGNATCPVCGQPFYRVGHRRVYCSTTCCKKAARERSREFSRKKYWARNPRPELARMPHDGEYPEDLNGPVIVVQAGKDVKHD